jgi:uncharacterized protein YidB (DUF937 family)
MSNKGMPSLLALLGLVAVAGYQNRDKLRDMIADARGNAGTAPAGGAPTPGAGGSAGGGILDEIGQAFGSGQGGRNLKDGLDSLLDRFRTAGAGQKADSWVSGGANEALGEDELEGAIGGDVIDELARRTGLTRTDLVERLRTALPETVNRLTPGGRLPGDEAEAERLI